MLSLLRAPCSHLPSPSPSPTDSMALPSIHRRCRPALSGGIQIRHGDVAWSGTDGGACVGVLPAAAPPCSPSEDPSAGDTTRKVSLPWCVYLIAYSRSPRTYVAVTTTFPHRSS